MINPKLSKERKNTRERNQNLDAVIFSHLKCGYGKTVEIITKQKKKRSKFKLVTIEQKKREKKQRNAQQNKNEEILLASMTTC